MIKVLKKYFFLLLIPLALVVFFLFIPGSTNAAITPPDQPKPPKVVITPPILPFRSVCELKIQQLVHCHAKVTTNDSAVPLAGSSPSTGSLGPIQIHTAYQLPCTPGGPVQSICGAPSQFGPNTIAVIGAYHNPTIENDLAVYSAYYGLPPCTKANGCLTVLDEFGGHNTPIQVDAGWTLESAMDVEIAHAVCQTCKILLIEANASTYLDLGTAVNTAAGLGVMAISNSYGSSEFSSQSFYDSYYNHPGIAVTVSSGDSGYGAGYPASSSNVVAVGGTSLYLFTDYTYSSESVWSGSGSGCSQYASVSGWQLAMPIWNQTGCNTKRAVADIAAVADPNTGAAVYDSTSYYGQNGWFQVGGTSLSAPIIAAAFALAGGVPAGQNAAAVLYSNPGKFHDISTGSNGFCSTIMCKGTFGYDGPTGLGSPDGLGPFDASSVTPTPTPTPPPADTSAPTITITSPLNGTTVRRGSKATISAAASDNVGVTKVEFYINNALFKTDLSSPYRVSWKVPSVRNAIYNLTAKAYDAAGNTSVSSVTVTSR